MEWGKGLVQTKAREDRLKDDLYEADKPLARYKDDRDLDKLLKNVEREGKLADSRVILKNSLDF